MMAKPMDWRRARLHDKPKLDMLDEQDTMTRDRAGKWLAVVEPQQPVANRQKRRRRQKKRRG